MDARARSDGALDRSGELLQWAIELAEAAHRAFSVTSQRGGRKRLVWKMSIDLTRPLVASMGQHDPLDGFVTCMQLDATARALGSRAGPGLAAARADFASMIAPDQLATSDPLGLGGLLIDAQRVEQLLRGGAAQDLAELRDALLAAAGLGLRHYVEAPDLRLPATSRLAFRELGLAIGLAGKAGLEPSVASSHSRGSRPCGPRSNPSGVPPRIARSTAGANTRTSTT